MSNNYGGAVIKDTSGIEWDEPTKTKAPIVKDTEGIVWDEPSKTTAKKSTTWDNLMQSDTKVSIPSNIFEDAKTTAPQKLAKESEHKDYGRTSRAFQTAKQKSKYGMPTEREVEQVGEQLSAPSPLELNEEGKPTTGGLEAPWVSPEFAGAGAIRAGVAALGKDALKVASGKGFMAGSIGGDVAAWTAHETVDKSLTDEFKQAHPILSETMKISAALVGGVAGGMAAERRYMQQYQSLLDDVKEGAIPPQQAEEVLRQDNGVQEIINKVETTRAKYAEERAMQPQQDEAIPPVQQVDEAIQPQQVEEVAPIQQAEQPPLSPMMEKVNAKLQEMGHEPLVKQKPIPVQAQRTKDAQEIPVGGSEDVAKAQVKQMFQAMPDSQYKKMNVADKKAYDEEYQRSLQYGPMSETGEVLDDFGQPLFSKAKEEPITTKEDIIDGTTTQSVRTIARKFLGKQYNKLKDDLNIVQTFDDLPEDLRKRTGLNTIEVGGKPRGIYDPQTGKAHLIADSMTDKEVQSVIVHELLHRHINSGRQVLGAEYDTFVLRLKQLKEDKLVKEAMDSVRSAGTPVKHMNEETMAYLVEKYQYAKDISPKLKRFISDIVEKVKVFIAETAVKLGVKPEWLISKMSADEIAQVLKSAAMKSGKGLEVKTADSLFSKAMSRLQEWHKDSHPLTKNEDGSPKVFYHGTSADFDIFDSAKIGASGGGDEYGYFFTNDISTADFFSNNINKSGNANIMPVFINITNPITMNDLMVYKNKTYSDLIRSTGDDAMWIFDRYKKDLGDILKANNYDGIILKDSRGEEIVIPIYENQIKSIHNRGTFDGTNPNILFSKAKEVIDSMPDVVKKKEAKAELLAAKSFNKRYEEFKDWFGVNYHDIFRPITKMQESIGIEEGSMIKWDVAGHRLVEKGKAKFQMDEVTRRVEDIEKRIVEASKTLEAQPEELRHLIDQYLISKHAPEYNKAVGEDLLGGAAGRSTQEAIDVVKAIGSNREVYNAVRQFSKEIQAMAKESLDVLLDAGILNKEQYDKIKGKYKYYVPMHRIMPDDKDIRALTGGSGASVKGTGIKKRVGSQTLEVADIMANVMFVTKSALDRAAKNKNAIRLAELLRQIKNPNSPMHNAGFAQMFDIKSVKAVGVDANGIPQMEHIADDGKTLFFREDGKPKYIKFQNQQMADAALDNHSFFYVPVFNEVGRWMSSVYTRFNIPFAPQNFIRDTQEMAVFLSSLKDMGAKGAASAAKQNTAALKGVVDYMRGADNDWSKLYKQLKEDGGVMGGYHSLGKKDIDVDVDTIFKEAMDIQADSEGAKRVIKKVFGWIDDYNTAFEDANRLSAYKAALDMGISRERAAWIARNATIDFDRKGKWSKMIGQFYIFFNPAVQGTTKFLIAMRNPKIAATVTTAVGSAVYGVNEYNDRMDKDWKKKVSPYDLKSGLCIVLPTKEFTYFKIPIAWAVRPLNAAFNQLWEMTNGEEKPAIERIGEVMKTFYDAYSPVQGESALSFVTPSMLDPIADIYTNQKSFGGIIRPDWMKDVKQSEQVFINKETGQPSIEETAAGRGVTHVSEGLSKAHIEFSPHDIDYALGAYLGGPYRMAKQGINNLAATVTDDKVRPEGIPITSAFYKKPQPEEIEKRQKGKPYKELVKKLQYADKTERKILIAETLNKLDDATARKSILYKLREGGFDTKGISPSDNQRFPQSRMVDGKLKQVTKEDIMLYHLRRGVPREEAQKLSNEWGE